MDDVKLTRKLKIARYSCQYSLTVMIVAMALILISFVVYLQHSSSIGADQLMTFLFSAIFLINFSVLLSAEGSSRKKAIGISFLLISIYYILEFFLVKSIFEPVYILQHVIEIFAVILVILLCVKAFGRLKHFIWRKVVCFLFIVLIALQLISYIFYGNLKLVEFILSVAAWIVPQMILYYIGIQAFNGEFYSHFIEENPKYFLPTGRSVSWRAIVMYIGGGLIALYLFLASR